jgi:hypothetical protein
MSRRIILTFKQHRFEVVASIVMCLVVTVGAVVEALRLDSIAIPDGCDPYAVLYGGFNSQLSPACREASQAWVGIRNGFDMRLLGPLPQVLPFVLGLLLGAPLVAREIENGTAPLSWALAGSRRNWLAARIGAMILLIVPLLLAVGLASDFLEGATTRGLNPWANFTDYMGRGVPLVFWGLAALAGTAALGTLIGRTMPALLLAMVICLFVRGAWDGGMNRTVLMPLSQVLVSPAEIDSGLTSMNDWSGLVVYQETYVDGKPWFGDINAWYNEHMTPTTDPGGNVITTMPVMDPSQMPYSVPFGIPGSGYWPIVILESGILVAGSMFCGAVALFWVGRRRPY